MGIAPSSPAAPMPSERWSEVTGRKTEGIIDAGMLECWDDEEAKGRGQFTPLAGLRLDEDHDLRLNQPIPSHTAKRRLGFFYMLFFETTKSIANFFPGDRTDCVYHDLGGDP